MKMKEWVGRLVRLKSDQRTEGGDVFLKGEVMVVTGCYRGKLTLNRLAKTSAYLPDNDGHMIKKIPCDDVDLLPNKPGKVLEAILKGLDEFAKSCDGVLAYEWRDDNGKKTLGKFYTDRVTMFRRVEPSGIVRGKDGLPTALMLGLERQT